MTEEKKAMAIQHLISYQETVRKSLEPLAKYRTALKKEENKVFHDDIDKEYYETVKSTLANHLAVNVGLAMDDSIALVEDLNVQEYLEG